MLQITSKKSMMGHWICPHCLAKVMESMVFCKNCRFKIPFPNALRNNIMVRMNWFKTGRG